MSDQKEEIYAAIVSYTDCCPKGNCYCSYGIIRDEYMILQAITRAAAEEEAAHGYQHSWKNASSFRYKLVKMEILKTEHFGN